MPAFVMEIGTEELPARFLMNTENELAARFTAALEEAGLTFAGLKVCSTPRRSIVFIDELAEYTPIREEILTGPPLKAAYDAGGRPTRAAEGFAKTHGVRLEDTFTSATEKGEYLAVRKTSGGESTSALLAGLCPAVTAALPFPKRMRWGDGEALFARPIRWILALFGDAVVPFSFGKTSSGNLTYGHRVHGPGPFEVPAAKDFFPIVRELGKVLPQGDERRGIIKEQGSRLAVEQGGTVLWKESLLDEVQGLCERPVPILGTFDPSYLEVPREVLLTSMESHQKSFGLEGSDGALLPYFLTVLNTEPLDCAVVRSGWERVLRARLEDARFFWKTDLAAGFEPWLQALESVTFLAPLGSMGDKSRRIERLCAVLADTVAFVDPRDSVNKAELMRAGRLCKADLVSAMVKEFDTLQGIMGGIYAGCMGESAPVAAGIREQYLPAGPETPVPSGLYGALVSIADKADTLAGCFGLGMLPTGAADPYALRRAALGIARIAQEKGLRFDAFALFAEALAGYGKREWKLEPDQALLRLQEFFVLRLKNLFAGNGVETLLVEACLQADARDVWAMSARLAALVKFSEADDFAQAVLTFKRAANIIRKHAKEEGATLSGKYAFAFLTDPAEKALAAEIERIDPIFVQLQQEDRYMELFGLLRDLRPSVDAFFASVMVMCEDEAQRLNRLNLLQALVDRLSPLADFAALQV